MMLDDEEPSQLRGDLPQFNAGLLCLNFANTVGRHDGTSPYDFIATFPELIDWLNAAGAISAQAAASCMRAAKARPRVASKALELAHELREALYRIISAAIHGKKPAHADLGLLNELLASASCGAQFAASQGGRFRIVWPEPGEDLSSLLSPVVRSAARLMTGDELQRVSGCHGKACDDLFLDMTKNRSRRYCTSTGCGNRTRVRRFYERHKTV